MDTSFFMFSMIVLQIIAIGLFAVGIRMFRMSRNRKKLCDEGTVSKELKHINDFGIFTEHGMVRSEDGKTVSAQSKASRSFIDCLD